MPTRSAGRVALSVLFLVAGALHLLITPAYVRIMPPWLPDPTLLVELSGLAEMLGGAGLLVPRTRRLAAWGLVALLIAVFPANLHMALDHTHWPGVPAWLLWARLPLQLPLIAWAALYTRTAERQVREEKPAKSAA